MQILTIFLDLSATRYLKLTVKLKQAHFVSVFLIVLYVNSFAYAQQKTIIPLKLYWTGYYGKWRINDKFQLHNEAEERRFFDPDKQSQFLVRSHLHYKLNYNWELSAGMAYFANSPVNPKSASTLIVPEWRPHVEIAYQQSIKRFKIIQRYRTEWRFRHNSNPEELLPGYYNYFRLRFFIGSDYLLFENKAKSSSLTLRVFEEIFINFGHTIMYNHFDQNRLYAGVQYKINRSLGLQLGYLYIFQQKTSGSEFYSLNQLRLTLQHQFGK